MTVTARVTVISATRRRDKPRSRQISARFPHNPVHRSKRLLLYCSYKVIDVLDQHWGLSNEGCADVAVHWDKPNVLTDTKYISVSQLFTSDKSNTLFKSSFYCIT